MDLLRIATLTPVEVIKYAVLLATPPLCGLALIYAAFVAESRMRLWLGVPFLAANTALTTALGFVVWFDLGPHQLRWIVGGAIALTCLAHLVMVRRRLAVQAAADAYDRAHKLAESAFNEYLARGGHP